jgi:hypothetical protein
MTDEAKRVLDKIEKERLERERAERAQARLPPDPDDEGSDSRKVMLIVAGVVAVVLGAILVYLFVT